MHQFGTFIIIAQSNAYFDDGRTCTYIPYLSRLWNMFLVSQGVLINEMNYVYNISKCGMK